MISGTDSTTTFPYMAPAGLGTVMTNTQPLMSGTRNGKQTLLKCVQYTILCQIIQI